MMNTIPLISVVIPVYNTEQRLCRCLDSLIKQTYKDFEIIVIDDGSCDKSGKICDLYAIKDSRIKVIHQKNIGVSATRNRGIKECIGKWIAFIDSDDYVSSDYLSNFFIDGELCEDSIYIQGCLAIKNGKQKPWPFVFKSQTIDLSDIQDYKELCKVLSFGCPWGRLYNKSLLLHNAIWFDETLNLHEDHIFYFQYIKFIKRIVLNGDTGIYYDTTPTILSLSHNTSKTMPRWEKLEYAYVHLKNNLSEFLTKNNINRNEMIYINHFILSIRLKALRSLICSYENKEKVLLFLSQLDRKMLQTTYFPKSLSGKLFKTILLINNPSIEYKLLQILKNKLK